MSQALPTGGDPEPFDEQAYLREIDRVEDLFEAPPHLLLLSRRCVAECIRLRAQAIKAQQRVTLLEAGQQLLPLTSANQPTQPHA